MALVVREYQGGTCPFLRDGEENCGGLPRCAPVVHGEKFCWMAVDTARYGELNYAAGG